MVVWAKGLTDVDGDYINDAATAEVTSIVNTTTGSAITGETFPVALAYIAASNGEYRGNIASALASVAGDPMTVTLTFVDTGSNTTVIKLKAIVKDYVLRPT